MNLNKIPAGENIPNDIYVIIEISAFSKPIKYEINKQTGVIFVDRIMYSTMFYPCNYGFINKTLSSDGDPIDALVITPYPIQAGSVIRCRPVGMLNMTDEMGEDNKIIAVPHQTLTEVYQNTKDINDIPPILKNQIIHFFKYYKKLDAKKWSTIEGWENAKASQNEICTAVQRALLK
ncbi:inorganic diphosphatase [Blochmannia endosymbiont of Polyrhachis (Hedomyrma) turneri]|uniref:inorganic diphosphatase n=1 Tax=Blochmannia endosymbiont of Polyrhachis (Hedomyrma) turneri TaxID=1505596 RepID=UPI00061A59B3|nr:inorganic diphosphatase [Blochmannia endosymbiont of Polyrhachis (Hedomyrma) turneri]AKC59677.1 inorganic pyrophosphatase [Blochmannia endosymbiont of Polyrhachis (Hedomyrma) turneri]